MKKFFILIFFISNLLFGFNNGFSKNEIKDFNNQTFFSIDSGNLKVDSLGNIIDGKYKLKKSSIEPLGNNQYKAILIFKKRKNRFIKFEQKRVIYFLKDDSMLWVKYKNKIMKYRLYSDKYITEKKIYYKEKRSTLHLEINKLKLFLSFK
ncbi:hypothetical protein CRV00_00860 [Malaciobacter molluscorum]|uniref:hypothetical protein n=1 Tax=Malaciobacter molluscorum TaxID=1032072 RepID=UPI00100ABC7C|nr:hypothetical protein [Malaciobacter molluscorum]RXJ97417.1 hypothetical protein CRV00_00860 [Malaciobacter molluscorum]